MKSSLSATRAERDTAISNAAEFKGMNVGEAKKAIAKVKEYANFNPEEKVAEGIKVQKEQLITEHNKAMDVKDLVINKLTGQVSKHLIDSTATTALAAHKGNVHLLLPVIKNQVKMTEVNGEYKAQILDGNGHARIGNTNGDLMTMDQLVAEMKAKPEFAGAFEGTGSSGGGAKPGGSTDPKTKQPVTGSRVIDADDQDGLNNSLEDMASGKATVQFND